MGWDAWRAALRQHCTAPEMVTSSGQACSVGNGAAQECVLPFITGVLQNATEDGDQAREKEKGQVGAAEAQYKEVM